MKIDISEKVSFEGKIVSIQPRILLTRSFDERFHNYLGYAIFLDGRIGDHERDFSVGLGKVTQAKRDLRAGDLISGQCLPVPDRDLEPVEFYKVSKLSLIERAALSYTKPPPWSGPPPSLEEYRERGHRRLAAKTYDNKCRLCIWGCRMAVEMIIDHWNPSVRDYRNETFCYGPLSCSLYRAGPTRKVPGRKGMVFEEEGWIDEQDTRHREPDE